MEKKRIAAGFLLASVLTAVLLWINTAVGSADISMSEILRILRGSGSDTMSTNIIWNIRLPRAGSAVLLGGALALSGYLLQTFFGNPIVGPFVLGISSGAKLTVALAMIASLSAGRELGLRNMVLAAFAGALIAMAFVLLISVKVKSMSVLVVCGIMIGYICSAVTDLVVTFADDSNIVNLHNWSMGSLSGMNWEEVRIIAVITAAGLILSVLMVKPIGAYRLGESYARSAGVNILLLRVMLILVSSLLAGCVTAFAGPISFVGIAVPHLVRSAAKTSSPGIMIPACFLGGAAVTLLCDLIARTVFAPTEVSISSVTAVLLVPVVIWMLLKRTRES
jgi:iron complex transport system permease protein